MKSDKCDYACHSGKKKHSISCCRRCPFCKNRIKNQLFTIHKQKCESARDPIGGATLEEISKALKKRKKLAD